MKSPRTFRGGGRWQRGSFALALMLVLSVLWAPSHSRARQELVARPEKGVSALPKSSFGRALSGSREKGIDPVDQTLARLTSLKIEPADVTLRGANPSQCFLVVGQFSDGLDRDLTSVSRLWLSKPRLAKIDGANCVTALRPGDTVLKARLDGRAANARIRIEDLEEKRPFSFERDIAEIFTKYGCNDSSCHGSVKGRGGFKLSLNATYPREDYKWIVEGGTYQVMTAETGPKVARIDLKEPEKSKLLLKPTLALPHGGGERFKVGSHEYQTILNWIRNGAPYAEKDAAGVKIERLEVFPKEVVLDPKGKHRLIVTARLSNGQRQDLTDSVRYASMNPDVVKVSADGLVEATKAGETAVVIRAPGQTVSLRCGVISKTLPSYPEVGGANFIDDYVFSKLRKFHIAASALSSDQEFLRRVCLDVTGTLPPPWRVREFLASSEPQKREKVIDALLNSPEYIDYWTFRFADLFRIASYASGGFKGSRSYWEWIRDSIEHNKPYDQMAWERLEVQGTSGLTHHYSLTSGPASLMAEEVRVFMGRRLDCAQCHDHPFDTWSQNQFWGMAAFFGRMAGLSTPAGGVLFDLPGGFGERGSGGPVIHPRTKQEVQPAFLDGKVLPTPQLTDPRKALAEWMTAHHYFAEAAVNRMWSYFFGRGIVDPVDDFRSTNPPTHPELLAAVGRDFEQHGYDLKRLIRLIVTSRTYQLSSIPNESNRGDTINYSHALPRALDAEVLLDAISTVTAVPERFTLQANVSGLVGSEPVGTRAIQLPESDAFPSRFLDIHGRPDRMAVPERDNRPNLDQALHTLAGSIYTEKLHREGGLVDNLLKSNASDRQIIEELSLTALSRFPTEREKAELESAIRRRPSRREAIEDMVWGMINSGEFTHNH